MELERKLKLNKVSKEERKSGTGCFGGGVPLCEYLLCNTKYVVHEVYKVKEHSVHKAFKRNLLRVNTERVVIHILDENEKNLAQGL